MKVPSATTSFEPMSDTRDLQSFTISHLLPSNIATAENGGAGIHSPYSTLVAMLRGNGCLIPGEHPLDEGRIVLIPPTCPCKVIPNGTSQIELAGIDFLFKSHGMDISGELPEVPMIIADNPAELLAKDICVICNSSAVNSTVTRTTEYLAAGFRIANTLSKLLRWDSNPRLSPPQDEELRTLTAFLESNFHLPLTIDDIAAKCNLSRRKTFKVASRHPDRTPMRILKQIRLERSLELLRRENFNVGQVAYTVGFGDARNFAREFKKSFGLTPLRYKQQSNLNVRAEYLLSKAESNMQLNINRRASVLYLQAIDSAPTNSDLNELYYKAGLALKRAGDKQGSTEAWSKVTALHYRLLIELEECEHLGKSSDCQLIVEKLRRVYQKGHRKLRLEVASQLSKWMLQCASAQNQAAAKHYSTFAKELAGQHPELRPNLARTLFATGQFKDVERYCPKEDFFIAAALRATGQFKEHLRRFPQMRKQCALVHLRMGNTAIIFSDYADLPTACVKALIEAGRPEEVLSRYPEFNAEALMALGRYEDILQQHPDDREMCVFALANLGRTSEALSKASFSADLTSRLLLYLEHPHEITASPSRGFSVQNVRAATVLQGIHSLETGDFRYGLEILDSVSSISGPDYRLGGEYYEIDLIIPFIRHLLSDVCKRMPNSKWPPLNDHLREIADHWRDCYAQQFWYDARFILGEVDTRAYCSQPYRRNAELRLRLVKGIKSELHGSHQEAVDHYRGYLEELPPLTRNYNASNPVPVIKAFIRWRLKTLA